jgi:hypothetical protein
MSTTFTCPNCQADIGSNAKKCDYCRMYQHGLAAERLVSCAPPPARHRGAVALMIPAALVLSGAVTWLTLSRPCEPCRPCPLPSAARSVAQRSVTAEPSRRSFRSDVATEIRFVNKSNSVVRVYWLDFGGHRKLYYVLRPGESYDQSTYITHPWVATDENDVEWLLYQPVEHTQTVEIHAPVSHDGLLKAR